jgi:aryl-alcohol dehydrogenase-like predicted oxidoreductase
MGIRMTGGSRLRLLFGSPARIGLGGEGVLRTEGKDREAQAVLSAAYESGIRYFDTAPAYAGSEQYLGRFWKTYPARIPDTFQTSKSAQRDSAGAAADLRRTLARLGRDQLGLWQIHDVRDKDDTRRIEGPEGALRAFIEARDTGTVRGIGVTGHQDPAILLHAVSHWDVDAVLLPVNPVEAVIGGFLDTVIPAARERGIGVIGMKTLGAGNFIFPDAGIRPDTLVRFALAQDTDIVIVGCSTPGEVQQLARAGQDTDPMDDDEQSRLIGAFRPYARQLAFYRGIT